MIHIKDDVPYRGKKLGLNGTYRDMDHFLNVVRKKMVQAGAASDEVNAVVKGLRER